MDPLTIALIAVIAVVVLIGLFFWATYNGLVKLNIRVDEAWSDITVQLKRRADLIPNLVESVKGYAAHESGVFEAVAKSSRRGFECSLTKARPKPLKLKINLKAL